MRLKRINLALVFFFLCGFGACPASPQKGVAPSVVTGVTTENGAEATAGGAPSNNGAVADDSSGNPQTGGGGAGGGGGGGGSGGGSTGGEGGGTGAGETADSPATIAGTPYGGIMPGPSCLPEGDRLFFQNFESSSDGKKIKMGSLEYVEVDTKIWLMGQFGGVTMGLNCKGASVVADQGTSIQVTENSGAHNGCVFTRIFIPADRKQVPVRFSYGEKKCSQDLQQQPNVNGMQSSMAWLLPEAYAAPPMFEGYAEAVYDVKITPETTTNVVTPCEITCKPFSSYPNFKAPGAEEMKMEEMEHRNCPHRPGVAVPSWCNSDNSSSELKK